MGSSHGWGRSAASADVSPAPTRSNTDDREATPTKVRNSIRSLKDKPGAQVVRRRGRVFVINKKNPRFKVRQG